MANNNNLNNIPYAQWLEQTLQSVINLPIKGICISGVLENGEVYTDYHKVNMMDKIKIAGIIQQDAMIDSLAANGYIDYADEEDEEEDHE